MSRRTRSRSLSRTAAPASGYCSRNCDEDALDDVVGAVPPDGQVVRPSAEGGAVHLIELLRRSGGRARRRRAGRSRAAMARRPARRGGGGCPSRNRCGHWSRSLSAVGEIGSSGVSPGTPASCGIGAEDAVEGASRDGLAQGERGDRGRTLVSRPSAAARRRRRGRRRPARPVHRSATRRRNSIARRRGRVGTRRARGRPRRGSPLRARRCRQSGRPSAAAASRITDEGSRMERSRSSRGTERATRAPLLRITASSAWSASSERSAATRGPISCPSIAWHEQLRAQRIGNDWVLSR